MESNREGSPMNFELPPSPEDGEQGLDRGNEAPAAPAETTGKRPKQPALPAVPDDIPVADTPLIAVPAPGAAAPANDPHNPAHDTDRIEHIWVDKAKQVIAQTRDDPYQQKHQMSQVKADYIQKRFGKQVKTDEASA